MENIYTLYVLYSKVHDKIYIGVTSDLLKRFYSHNKLGSKDWTRHFRPWFVVYCEYFDDIKDALKREKQLKSAAGRKYIREKCIPSYRNQFD